MEVRGLLALSISWIHVYIYINMIKIFTIIRGLQFKYVLLVIWKTILERRYIVLKLHLCATQDSGISCVKWTWCTVCYMRCAHKMCVVWWYDVDFDSRVCKSWLEMVITPPTHPLHTQTHQCSIYASVNCVSISSGIDLSPVRRQVNTGTNAELLSI